MHAQSLSASLGIAYASQMGAEYLTFQISDKLCFSDFDSIFSLVLDTSQDRTGTNVKIARN